MNTTMTAKQSELWKLANAELVKIGGTGRIMRNPDPVVRALAKTEGTREWALMESTRLASPSMDSIMNDDYCQRLINCINTAEV